MVQIKRDNGEERKRKGIEVTINVVNMVTLVLLVGVWLECFANYSSTRTFQYITIIFWVLKE